jgi:ABC-type nitrate/sulfonate/bicarbonate transport system substrate-binding protein
MMETSMEVIRAQRAYLDAAGKSESELKEAAEEYLKATGPYDAALQELRQFLLAAEPSEMIAVELDHTERLIEALYKEKQVVSKLIEHHVEMNAQNVKPTSRHNQE